MFLTGAIVHLEPIPGVSQDWLARPIPRGALLLEKSLYVVVTVAGPILVANIFLGVANGFPLRSVLFHTTTYVLYLLFHIVLPIFALASVTRNMTEAFILGCGSAFIIGASLTLVEFANSSSHGTIAAVMGSGVGWIGETVRLGLAGIAAAMILGVQYFRRKTFVARALMVGFGLLILGSQIFPWKTAFTIQERISGSANSAAHVQVAFDPAQARYKSPVNIVSSPGRQRGGGENDANVFLPLRLMGVGDDEILLTDHADVQLMSPEGRPEYHGTGETFEVMREELGSSRSTFYEKIVFPGLVYREVKDRATQMQIEFSLTLFGLTHSYSVPALNGSERMPGWGWCETQLNEAGTAVELHCLQQGKGPICGAVFLENSITGERNPPRSMCRSDYAPYLDRPLPDSLERFGTILPFRDPTALAKYPVDGARLAQSHIVIRVYEPEEHFTRSLSIPQIKLQDWDAQ
jgi:hypothetical protein